MSAGRHASVWMDTAPPGEPFPALEEATRADVAVIGGGIVGITTALLLQEAGASVVLLEADRLAAGVTGHTTAKVSSQHGLIYAELTSRFGADTARAYGEANEAAIEWIARRVDADGIACDFRRRPSYAYVTASAARPRVEAEARAAAAAGLPARLVETTPLPYPVEAAVRFDDQAEFHVRRYLLALVERLVAAGARIHEGTRAVEVDEDEDCSIKTPGGRVLADRVVVATHYPFLDRSLAFARVHPTRSYALLCRIAGTPPEGLFISADEPTRSVRAVPVAGEELLLVGGEGHRPGAREDTEERYRRLEDFARHHWDVQSVEYRWSAQDNTTIDGLPYIGRVRPNSERVLMATGLRKWGMTGGTVAALVLADRLQERESPWARIFDPYRVPPLSAAAQLVRENAPVAANFVGDRLRRTHRPLDDLLPGEGDIVRLGDEDVAAFRDEDGAVTALAPVCTHLGCRVRFNSAERSWDCPCHGSRFAVDGTVLQGPAVHRLQRRPLG